MRARGFTLIELVITVAIVAVLATAIVPSAQLFYQRERESELRDALRTLRTAIDDYKRAYDSGRIRRDVHDAQPQSLPSGYPPDLQTLVDGVDDASSPKEGVRIYFLRHLPRDPFWPDSTTPAAQTWALRAYASPPDDPQPGEDVFDVYSRSAAVGINGVPYHEW